jgi:hypothetical protein
MQYLNLNSRLTITDEKSGRSIVFGHISSAEIKRSVKVIGDTAEIVIPRRYGELKNREVLQYIKAGYAVKLELGYDGERDVEFTGYVREVESGYPVRIQADDKWYAFRKNSFNKSWKQITLRELLKYVMSGYKIECPDVNMGAFQIDNASTLTVLRTIQQQYGFYSSLRDRTLYCQFAYDFAGKGAIYTYDFAKNVKPKAQLTYKRKEDIKLKITAISNLKSGKKLKVEVGSKDIDAEHRTLNFANKTVSELRQLALKQLDALVFDGLQGNVTGFGYPRVNAGDTLRLVSEKEPERNGDYLVEEVTIRYGNAYYERICGLSYKVKS